jgi:hypothetical protein
MHFDLSQIIQTVGYTCLTAVNAAWLRVLLLFVAIGVTILSIALEDPAKRLVIADRSVSTAS